ncbi:MAG TPA: MBL fold metallo-hydrolase [Polyangiaceae bacterium]|nr:MBL fold metallo-hydrolase [Polyangiaceae bacterium]
MKRALEWAFVALFGVAALLSLLLLLAGVSLRSNRHDTSVPTVVTSRVVMVRNFLSDVYAARIGQRVIVFDAGMDADGRALEVLLEALGSDVSEVSDIFLTHGHFDHVAAAGRCPSAKIHIGAADAEVLAHRAASHALVPRLFSMLLSVPAVEATDRLSGSSSIDVGNGDWVIAVPLPGHTPGSYVYLFDGVLFTGDALFVGDGGITLAAPEDEALARDACRGVAQINALFREHRVTAICTGHRGCTEARASSRSLEALAPGGGPNCPG